jgi:dihydropyrimidine dehydrogenase (NAD+) subunit PreA
MVSQVAGDPGTGLPVSAMGGIATWRDAAEFILLGAQTVQLCSAVMHHGFRIIEDLTEGLANWMDEKGFPDIEAFRGRSLKGLSSFSDLNLLYSTVARIDEASCIRCNLCYIACEDGAHQSIDLVPAPEGVRPRIREDDCVGCALCFLVCPVEGCITMARRDDGKSAVSWTELMRELPQPVTWEALRRFQERHGIRIV